MLSGVDLDVADGEFVALLGPSGCGKTTLLRVIAGLEQPDEGAVLIGEREVTALDPAARNIALVFQSYALYPHKTVFENIAFPLRMRAPWFTRLPLLSPLLPQRRQLDRAIQPQVRDVAAQVGIEAYLTRKPAALSGGQRQRVALARALVREPDAFLMDEPLSNLDAKLRASMRLEISELQRRHKATFLYVTHDQVEAMTMADRVVLLHQGTVQQVGAPMSLYKDPQNRFVAEFIGTPSINMLRLEAGSGETASLSGLAMAGVPRAVSQAARESGGALWLGLRPDHIRLAPDSPDAIEAIVRLVEPLGSEAFATLALSGPASPRDGQGDGQPDAPHPDTPRDTPQRIVMRLEPDVAASIKQGDRLPILPDWAQALAFGEDGRRLALPVARAAA